MDDTDGYIAEYVYNGLGQRVIKITADETTYFHYDPDNKLIAETPAGSITTEGKEYLYNGKVLLAQVEPESGMIFTFHTNYLGAVHQLTDHNGTIVWEATYKPFGTSIVHPGSIVTNHWRMPGQYFDEETGLHYNYHRYYDTTSGRYLTPDPIGLAGGINPYVYVANNPVNEVDPYGLEILVPEMASDLTMQECDSLRGWGSDTWLDRMVMRLIKDIKYSVKPTYPGERADIVARWALTILTMRVFGVSSNTNAVFGKVESTIINEARSIMQSSEMAALKAAHEAGKTTTVRIAGRMIQYEPNLPGSGLSMFGENGFLIGPEAFTKSSTELGKTILHELHRLYTSNAATGVSANLAAQETAAAADFAQRAIGVLK